jgi:Uma2 family endonuclease
MGPTMSVAEAALTLMTTEDLLALPDDGVERWLINGQLRENHGQLRVNGMTVRNRKLSRIMIRVGKLLDNWLDQQPEPRGSVLGGEAGVRLRRNPNMTVGIDVLYVSAEVAAQESEDTTLIDGVPVLVVVILSPNDTQEQVDEKIDGYLQVGVALVWVIDPHYRTVEVFRPSAEPEMFNIREELSGEPHLPGFSVPVAQIFS